MDGTSSLGLKQRIFRRVEEKLRIAKRTLEPRGELQPRNMTADLLPA